MANHAADVLGFLRGFRFRRGFRIRFQYTARSVAEPNGTATRNIHNPGDFSGSGAEGTNRLWRSPSL